MERCSASWCITTTRPLSRVFTRFCEKWDSRGCNYKIAAMSFTNGPGGLHTVMEPRTRHALELAAAVVCQTILLAAWWGFMGAVFACNPLIFSDYFADLMFSKPTEKTWVVTLLATILSVATTTYGCIKLSREYPSQWFTLFSFLSIAFKEALRHRIHRSISLIHLSGGIALTRNSFFINFRHPTPALVTILVFGVTKLLVSRYTGCSVLQGIK